MRKNCFLVLALTVFGFLSGMKSQAQPYSNAVMALQPVGYWPLTESVIPPSGYYIATNLGTAGNSANGYYQTWYHPLGTGFYPSNNIVHGPGAIGDGDTALQCGGSPAGLGQYVIFPRATNGVANPAVAVQAPFSIEFWVKSGNTNLGVQPIVTEGRNPVAFDPAVGATNTYVGFSAGQFKNFFYFQVYNARANGNGQVPECDTPPILPNTWYHVVATFDGTAISIFANGTQSGASKTVSLNYLGQRYVVDPVCPLLIGTGTEFSALNGGLNFNGSIDEVAIYPAALSASQISTHYAASSGTGYSAAVLADGPQIYLRLDEQSFSTYPAPSTYPVATNYGLLGAAANGVFQPGTAPGAAGPAFSGFGGASRAVAFNSFYGAVDVGGGALPPELNPTGAAPFSVVTWFQGNPADAPGRFQVLAGHSDRSWRLTMDGGTASSPGGNRFNPGNGPELSFVNTADVVTNGFRFNDGQWHMAAGVSDGTTDYLYLDGVLARTATGVGSIVGTNLDVILGGDPTYTVPTANSPTIRNFDGQLAQVAFFTNALSGLQIQQLYGSAGVPASILTQPPAALTTNSGATISIPVIARGSAPLSFQWYRISGTPVAGQTAASLTFNPVTTNNADSYYLVVTNSTGSATSSVVQLTVLGPPVIQQQSPSDVRVFAGMTPALRVTAIGPPPLIYQWKLNGTPITGATNSAYTVTNTSSLGASAYDCTITNSVGTASIAPITVTVVADPTAPYPAMVLADKPLSYFRLDEGPENGSGNNGVTAYDYAGGLNGSYSNVYLQINPGYNAATDPAETAAQFGYYQAQDSYAGNVPNYLSFAAPSNTSVQFSVEAWVNSTYGQSTDAGLVTIGYGFGGEQMTLDVGGRNGTTHTFRFYVNDANGVTHTATSTDTVAPSDGLWHHLVGVCDEANGKVSLYIDGMLKGSGTITPGSGIRSLTAPLSIGSRLSTSAATHYDNQFIGNMDDVAIYGAALSASQVQSHYFASGIAPVLTQIQPWNAETNQGATATFTVTAAGTPPLSYQWSDNNSVPIVWGTNATLTLTNVQQDQAGTYTIQVGNAYGSATTNGFLTVDLGAPTIVADLQPLDQTVYGGVSLTYSVTVSGSTPFGFQWYRNGSIIAGATNSSYTFPALVGTNTYYAAVTNVYSQSQVGGPTYSSTATVAGVQAPTLNPSDYNYKMKITFAGYNRGETLPDFPVLVKLGTNTPGFAYSQMASASGGDLRFTDANGAREIPHEIDEWNPDGVSSVWVQVPRLSGTNDSIWAYWGNGADAISPAYATNGSVWVPQPFENLPSFKVVYHLKESAFPFADSSTQHPATTGIAPTPAPGIVGQGGLFNGSFLDAGTFDLADVFTLSAWVNINPGVSDIQTIWANQTGGFAHPGFAMTVNSYQTSDQQLRLASGNGVNGNETATASGAVGFGQWHFVSESINRTNGTVDFYVDGAKLSSASSVVKDFPTTNDVNLGQFVSGSFPMHGLMDEARIRGDNSSSNWVWASYMTVAQNSAFQSYSSITSSLVTLGLQAVGNNIILTWPQGTLQSAIQVGGPYTDLPTATSPYTNAVSGTQKFFRVKVR